MSKLEESAFKSKIAFSLAKEFRRMWEMTRNAIEQIPENEWTHGVESDKDWFYSLRVYHIIETAEFYFRDTPKGMLWGARLGQVKWWETISAQEAAEKVVKGDMLIYMNEMAQYIEENLKRVSDKDLLAKGGFQGFSTILEKYIYLIRHTTYHLGELTMDLRVRGLDRIKWS
jgi:hypothetical protein